MNIVKRRVFSPLFSLPYLLFVFLLVLTASFLLAEHGIAGIFSATLFNTPQGIILLVFGPLVLLILISFLMYGIVSNSLHTAGSSRLRFRIFSVISVLVLAATVPQTVIVSRFAGTVLSGWFDSTIPDALDSAEDIAALYQNERIRLMETVSLKYMNGLAISNYRTKPYDWISEIRAIDPDAAACQVYLLQEEDIDTPWDPVMEAGNSSVFVPREQLSLVRNGPFSLDDSQSVYRYGQLVFFSSKTYLCVYTSYLDEKLYAKLAQIRETAGKVRIVNTIKPYFPVMGIWLFFMFCLPPVCMVLILAWYFSSSLAGSVRSLHDALALLANGERGAFVVNSRKDELGAFADLVNRMTETAGDAKKPDKKVTIRL